MAAPNPDNNLQPGTSVQVALVARVVPDAVVVPVSAVLTDSDGAKSVMLVASDLKAHRRAIGTGIENNGMVQILSGVQPGEEIIATGAYGLPDNTRVKAMPASSTAQSSSQP